VKYIDQLTRVIAKESDFADKLSEIIEKKQQAIIRMDADSLAAIVQAEEQVIAPLQTLEEERCRLVATLLRELPEYSSNGQFSLNNMDEILPLIPGEESALLGHQVAKLRNTVAKIVQLNENNKALIAHSHRFVQEMLRILTDNYKRQFVDQKM
jgi:flagellar biosynthesis/type III secretory pathway chaperone